MGISSCALARLGEDAAVKLSAFVEVSEVLADEVGISLTNVVSKSLRLELGQTIFRVRWCIHVGFFGVKLEKQPYSKLHLLMQLRVVGMANVGVVL